MKSWWRLILAGLAAYALFLVLNLPAARLLSYLHLPPGAMLDGVSGTVWSGRAARLNVGAVPVTGVSWRWRPLALLRGALEFAVQASLGEQPVAARAGIGLLSGRYVSDVVGRLALADALYWSGMNMARVEGRIDFAIDRVEGIGAGLPAVAGKVSWAPAKILEPLELDLGQAQMETRIEDGRTLGSLATSGGVLVFAGELTANPDGNYGLVGTLQKKGSVPQAVDSFLTNFAEFSNGVYRLEWSDQLNF